MKSVLGFIARNKLFVIIAGVGILALIAFIAIPAIQKSATPKPAVTVADPGGPRVIDGSTPTETPTPSPDPTDVPTDGDEDADPNEDTANGGYVNNGEWSPRAAQAYLPAGVKNPVDSSGNPIVWQTVKMSDPTPVANEFAKQWANPTGGKDAWLERLRPVITDDLNYDFGFTTVDKLLSLTVTGVVIDKDAGLLDSGFYRFTVAYKGCGDAIIATLQPQPEGSWLVDTVDEAQQSTPATRGKCG